MTNYAKSPTKNTGVIIKTKDRTQPFQVWYQGMIFWFAKDEEEAEKVLEDVKLKGRYWIHKSLLEVE